MQQTEEKAKLPSLVKGYPRFVEVESNKLRAYNRCMVLRTFSEDDLKEAGMEYLSSFDKSDTDAIILMAFYIREHGYDETLKEIQEETA